MIEFLVLAPPALNVVEEVVEITDSYRERDCTRELCPTKPPTGLPPDFSEADTSPVRLPNIGFTIGASGTMTSVAPSSMSFTQISGANLRPLDPSDTPRWPMPLLVAANAGAIWAAAPSYAPAVIASATVYETHHGAHFMRNLRGLVIKT